MLFPLPRVWVLPTSTGHTLSVNYSSDVLARSSFTILLLISGQRLYGDDEDVGFGGTQIQLLICTASPRSYAKAIEKSTIVINDNDGDNDDS